MREKPRPSSPASPEKLQGERLWVLEVKRSRFLGDFLVHVRRHFWRGAFTPSSGGVAPRLQGLSGLTCPFCFHMVQTLVAQAYPPPSAHSCTQCAQRMCERPEEGEEEGRKRGRGPGSLCPGPPNNLSSREVGLVVPTC